MQWQTPFSQAGITDAECSWGAHSQVPGRPPSSRGQWADWSRIWPMAWRQPETTALALVAQPPALAPEECQSMRKLMSRAWDLALAATGCSSPSDTCNACLLVDPASGALLCNAPTSAQPACDCQPPVGLVKGTLPCCAVCGLRVEEPELNVLQIRWVPHAERHPASNDSFEGWLCDAYNRQVMWSHKVATR